MSEKQRWEFHFRNFNDDVAHVEVHHMGCGMTPWHDGRPGCWTKKIEHNPRGGNQSVYVPSDWVVHFSDWFNVISDGLKGLVNLGVFIGSGGTDAAALIKAMVNICKVPADVVKASVDELSEAEVKALLNGARASLASTCASVGVAPEEIISYAKQMNLGSDWAFIAGKAYKHYIHDKNKTAGGGWSVFHKMHDRPMRIAHAAFIESGHMIMLIDEKVATTLWHDKW